MFDLHRSIENISMWYFLFLFSTHLSRWRSNLKRILIQTTNVYQFLIIDCKKIAGKLLHVVLIVQTSWQCLCAEPLPVFSCTFDDKHGFTCSAFQVEAPNVWSFNVFNNHKLQFKKKWAFLKQRTLPIGKFLVLTSEQLQNAPICWQYFNAKYFQFVCACSAMCRVNLGF